jgi:hypothetical protein
MLQSHLKQPLSIAWLLLYSLHGKLFRPIPSSSRILLSIEDQKRPEAVHKKHKLQSKLNKVYTQQTDNNKVSYITDIDALWYSKENIFFI